MVLNVLGIHFRYNSRPVLEDVRLDVEAGELVAVCGGNGAGKSTLLKCINGILSPFRGTVLLEGEEVRLFSRDDIARRIAFLPQHTELNALSVFETVLLGRLPHRRWGPNAEDVELVERILKSLDLADLAHRPFSSLSGGERQKVVLARALAQSPQVLLLDEPTNHLDIKNQLEVMETIVRLVRREKLASIVAIHDLNLALRYSDRLVFLKNGGIHAVVTPQELSPRLVQKVYGVEVRVEKLADYVVVVPR